MFLKREKKNDCMIAGFAVSDQKNKDFDGKDFVEVGIGLGKDESGEQLPIVSVTIWERRIPEIHKGDRVFACGKLKKTEKDGKVYYSMSADFVAKEDSKRVETPPELKEIEADDLPF